MANTTNDTSDRFADSVDEYLTKTYDGERRRRLLEHPHFDSGFAQQLRDLGWYALAVPEEHDGLGVGLDEVGAVFAQLGRHLVVGPQLESFLLPALLPHIVDPSGVTALVDPGVTDDWRGEFGSVSMTDGRLEGEVKAVRFACQASLLIVVATTTTGEVLCTVDPAAPGVEITEVASADPAALFARVMLSGVGAETVGGADLVTTLRAWARLLIASELGGLAHQSLTATVEYVAHREQFGRPIGSFQALKHIAADMHTTWAGLDSLCRAVVSDAARSPVGDLELLGKIVKAHAAGAATQVCESAIQLHGGMGFTTETDVSWYYRRVLSLRAWYGDSDELQHQIGATIFDQRPRRDTDTPAAPEILERSA